MALTKQTSAAAEWPVKSIPWKINYLPLVSPMGIEPMTL